MTEYYDTVYDGPWSEELRKLGYEPDPSASRYVVLRPRDVPRDVKVVVTL